MTPVSQLTPLKISTRYWAPLLAAASISVGFAFTKTAATRVDQPQFVISQQGRAFSSEAVTLERGQSIRIVNDDGDLRHHAYVEASTFSFDSGDQEPGSNTDVAFPVPGTFDVLCGIHPKMKMVVTVK